MYNACVDSAIGNGVLCELVSMWWALWLVSCQCVVGMGLVYGQYVVGMFGSKVVGMVGSKRCVCKASFACVFVRQQ